MAWSDYLASLWWLTANTSKHYISITRDDHSGGGNGWVVTMTLNCITNNNNNKPKKQVFVGWCLIHATTWLLSNAIPTKRTQMTCNALATTHCVSECRECCSCLWFSFTCKFRAHKQFSPQIRHKHPTSNESVSASCTTPIYHILAGKIDNYCK